METGSDRRRTEKGKIRDKQTERNNKEKTESKLGVSQNKGDSVGWVKKSLRRRTEWGAEFQNSSVSRHDIEYILHKEGPENTLAADSCLALCNDWLCVSLQGGGGLRVRAGQILPGKYNLSHE